MPKAVIAFGSNIDPETHVPQALRRLKDRVRILGVSRVYETPPVGANDAPPYLNGALLIETELPPRELHDAVLRDIESALGRVRTDDPNAPRTIDLDLILYEGVHTPTGDPPLPSPDVYRYAHVALPVAEVAGDWPLDEGGTTVAQVARSLLPAARHFRDRTDVLEGLEDVIPLPETPTDASSPSHVSDNGGDIHAH